MGDGEEIGEKMERWRLYTEWAVLPGIGHYDIFDSRLGSNTYFVLCMISLELRRWIVAREHHCRNKEITIRLIIRLT